MGKKVELEAKEEHPETDPAERLAHHSAGHLGEPISKRAEQREHRAADQHIMEVRDDEVGVVKLEIERNGGNHHAGQSADHEGDDESAT